MCGQAGADLFVCVQLFIKEVVRVFLYMCGQAGSDLCVRAFVDAASRVYSEKEICVDFFVQ